MQFHFNLVIALCTTSGFVLVISLLSTPHFIGSLLQFCKDWFITEVLLLGLLIGRLSSSSSLFYTSLLQINMHTDIQRWSVRVDVLTGCVVSLLVRCCSLSRTPKNSCALQNSRVFAGCAQQFQYLYNIQRFCPRNFPPKLQLW